MICAYWISSKKSLRDVGRQRTESGFLSRDHLSSQDAPWTTLTLNSTRYRPHNLNSIKPIHVAVQTAACSPSIIIKECLIFVWLSSGRSYCHSPTDLVFYPVNLINCPSVNLLYYRLSLITHLCLFRWRTTMHPSLFGYFISMLILILFLPTLSIFHSLSRYITRKLDGIYLGLELAL